ncbi:MAG: hypothetical protein AAFU85_29145, partial [Planctomycetota bacterium]
MTDPTESPWTTHRFAITLAIHLFLGIMVSTRAWVLQEDRAFMALASLPMAQCSLIAIWAATSQAPDYVRFTLGVGAVFACWYELSTLIAWAGTGTTAMLWIVLLLYQTLFVLIGIASTRWMLRYVAAQAPRTEQFSFRIRTLNLWTAVVAITLTFFNFGRVNWQWDLGWMRSGVHVTVAIIALLNAVVACLWSSVWHSKSVTHGLVRGGVTFLLLIVFCWLADLVVTRWGVMIASDSLFH